MERIMVYLNLKTETKFTYFKKRKIFDFSFGEVDLLLRKKFSNWHFAKFDANYIMT
jgi:hypothetical protein